jgi:hypothetical protein
MAKSIKRSISEINDLNVANSTTAGKLIDTELIVQNYEKNWFVKWFLKK